jgi:ABC-2 type transport system permease protein
MSWWKSIASMELRKILAYRSDFWITFVGQTLIQFLVAKALWQNIFESKNISSMNGFDLSRLSLYYLLVPITSRVLSGENIGFLSREIYEGQFTKYLIYPLNFFQYKSITYLTHSFFYLSQLILSLFIFKIFNPEVTIQISSIALGCFFLIISALCYLFMSFCIELISIWADNIWSLMLVLRFFVSFLGGGFVPISFFPESIIQILKFFPFYYLINFPILIMQGQIDNIEILKGLFILILWIVFFIFAMKRIWRLGEKSYSGVGI